MTSTVLHRAETRGHADHGWLNSYHTFSFASYFDAKRVHFGALRVLNDDTVDAGMGFDTHHHKNMEIISIPLEGDLEHKDSMGTIAVIRKGDVQVMSAGSGIFHSEYNRNKNIKTKFLQIWILPNEQNVTPRYDQITLNEENRHNKFQQILSPNQDDAGVWIHQDAWFHLGNFDKGFSQNYALKKQGNGVYVFVLSGNIKVGNEYLNARDGLGMWNTDSFEILADTDAEFLMMEVPMNV
jgi:redox-sensitive bicupin YhaK (pirin superfamily)